MTANSGMFLKKVGNKMKSGVNKMGVVVQKIVKKEMNQDVNDFIESSKKLPKGKKVTIQYFHREGTNKKNDEDKFFDRTITNEKNKPEVLFQDGTSI